MSKNLCPECQIRPIGGGPLDGTWNDRQDAKSHNMCLICLAEAYWTNAHSDNSHDSHDSVNERDSADYLIADCWVCNPSLDRSSEAYKGRTGTSRVGMTLVVPLKASAAEKAEVVKAQLPKGFRTQVQIGGALGILAATLTGSKGPKANKIEIVMNWDGAGRFVSGSVNGKNVRNAKELLRVLSA